MSTLRTILLIAPLVLAACASVTTKVVQFNPAQHYPPTYNVEVLLQKPTRPNVELALIEARGDSEADSLNEARDRAKALGADAIVQLETERIYNAPVPIYDPWYDPLFYGYYRYRPFPPYPYPWNPYRVVGGGYTYLLKTLAIKYIERAQPEVDTR
jgi:hypothetical protein